MRLSWGHWGSDTDHGYGYIGTRYPIALRSAGITVLDPYEPDWDLLTMVTTPVSWMRLDNNVQTRLVMHTMFEGWPLPKYWVENMNEAGLIWTPSRWSAALFREAGVVRPIMVAGYGVDESMIKPVLRRPDHPLKVVVWGDTLFSRKNVWQAINVFNRADIPGATLEVKISSVVGRGMFGNIDIGSDRVNIIADSWSEAEIIAWLHSADVGMYLSGGEGFGLMPIQMMATGLPVICAYNTAMREYLSDQNSLPVPCKRGAASPGSYDYPVEHGVPDFDRAVDLLRWVADNREEAARIGMHGAMQAGRMQWCDVASRAKQNLMQYLEQGDVLPYEMPSLW